MIKKVIISTILLITTQLILAKPFKDITSMAQLDSMSIFSFAVMSDNKGDALNKKEFKRMDKWIKETKVEFVIGLGDHVKRSWKNQFVDFLKKDKWWYTHFYPVLADGENEYYGESQADRSKGKKFLDLTNIKERNNVEFTEEGSEYYAKFEIKGYTVHFISLFYPDYPSNDSIAFPETSKKYLIELLNSIEKTEKDIVIAGAHSRTGYWLNNLSKEQLDIVLDKTDLVLSATSHIFQVFNTYGGEKVPLAINTGAITHPRLFCKGGYVQVNVVEDPAALVVQYINAEKKDRKLANNYYSAVKRINGEVFSANFKELKKKDDPNRIVAETSKEYSTDELKVLLQNFSMEKFEIDTAIINNFRGLSKGDINYIEYLSIFPYKNKIVTMNLNAAQYDSVFSSKAPKELMKITTDSYTGEYIANELEIDKSKIEKTDYDEMKLLKKFMKKSKDIKFIDD
ncbi:MAG: hypothetical protein PF574_05580 [Candidatus Delongbacteria bacterium]|jgi:hypothetical protein|nr:hypothetical protein [Candidatus Delongbacteria bacterium]